MPPVSEDARMPDLHQLARRLRRYAEKLPGGVYERAAYDHVGTQQVESITRPDVVKAMMLAADELDRRVPDARPLPTLGFSTAHMVAVLRDVGENWYQQAALLDDAEKLICALGRDEAACARLAALLEESAPGEPIVSRPPAGTPPEEPSDAEQRRLHDYPMLAEFFNRYALGPKAAPSCFVCGQSMQGQTPAVQHGDLPGIVACAKCKSASESAASPAPSPLALSDRHQRAGDRHFFVFVEGGNAPKHGHGTRDEAKAEAQRLANKTKRTTWMLFDSGYVHPENGESLSRASRDGKAAT